MRPELEKRTSVLGRVSSTLRPPVIGTPVSMEVPTIACPSLLRVWLCAYWSEPGWCFRP